PDGGLALALEYGVDHGELPARGGTAGPDAVLAAKKADVLRPVAGCVDARQAGADPEVHVGHETVLRIAGAHADRAGVAVRDLEIDIGDGRIDRARAGIPGLAVAAAPARTAGIGRRLATAAAPATPATRAVRSAPAATGAGPPAGEQQHLAFLIFILV